MFKIAQRYFYFFKERKEENKISKYRQKGIKR